MRPDARCRSCTAPIRWVLTTTGKRMPIDLMPAPDGNVWIDHYDGATPVVGVALNRDGVPAGQPFTYVSHFVTCKDADSWRKRK